MRLSLAVLVTAFVVGAGEAKAQIYPPGAFAIDGIPVVCGGLPTAVDIRIPDAAMNNGQAILINPAVVGRLPTVLKLFTYAHECGHAVVGADELAADCWAIQTGKSQGWFPPEAFGALIALFQNNRGDIRHPPGPVRIENMRRCYGAGDSARAQGRDKHSSSDDSGDDFDRCYDPCQRANDRCTSRCERLQSDSASDRCYDRCQAVMDRCTSRC